MIVTGSRLRQLGWFVILAICLILFLALKFRVDAVKSEVRLAERAIVALENDKVLLETEFETRSNQQQLARWNTVDFGYSPPKAEQFVENERQLAVLGTPRGINAPDPIRVARAPVQDDEGLFPAMVSPISGQSAAATVATVENASAAQSDADAAEVQPQAQPALALADRLAAPDAIPDTVNISQEGDSE